jgi:hypothetical protein
MVVILGNAKTATSAEKADLRYVPRRKEGKGIKDGIKEGKKGGEK